MSSSKSARIASFALFFMFIISLSSPAIAQERPGLSTYQQLYISLDHSISTAKTVSDKSEEILNKCDEISELIKSIRWVAHRNPRKKK